VLRICTHKNPKLRVLPAKIATVATSYGHTTAPEIKNSRANTSRKRNRRFDRLSSTKKRKVGVRIDILYPPVYHPRAAPIPERQWVDVGYIPVTVLKLSKNQIQNIKKIEHQATLTPFIYSGRYQLSYLRSHDAVIRVYDNAGNVIETHEHTGDFVEP
jgi:hypothetical protein